MRAFAIGAVLGCLITFALAAVALSVQTVEADAATVVRSAMLQLLPACNFGNHVAQDDKAFLLATWSRRTGIAQVVRACKVCSVLYIREERQDVAAAGARP